jgi:hypothetical protein
VVGPGGVFVIDSKAWSGRVQVREGVLRQNGRKRESAVTAAADAAMAVAEQVPGLNPYVAKPVLCFVGDHRIEGWARDVMLCTPQNLVTMLLSRPVVLDGPAVRRTSVQLQQSLAAAANERPRTASSSRRVVVGPAWRSRTGPRSEKGSGRGVRTLLGRLALILVGLVAMGALVRQADDIARAITSEVPGATSDGTNKHPIHGLGLTQALPAAVGRPPLRVTASKARTVHRIGTSPYLFDGNRFFGVRLTVVNRGDRVWLSQPGTTYQVSGESMVPRRGGSAIRIREGTVLPDPIRLAPGHRVTGYVVFQVPIGAPVTSASMTVGPGKSRTVSWRIDRQ